MGAVGLGMEGKLTVEAAWLLARAVWMLRDVVPADIAVEDGECGLSGRTAAIVVSSRLVVVSVGITRNEQTAASQHFIEKFRQPTGGN